MFLQKKILGRIGEDYAVAFLKKQGYTIIERNFRVQGGEIDIIAIDTADGKTAQTLSFIEVKTRSSGEYGEPIEAIGYYKMKALTRTAHYYKYTHRGLPDLMRLDAVIVKVDENKQLIEIELVKNIM